MHIVIHNSDYTAYKILNVVSIYVKLYINGKLCLLHITLCRFVVCQYLNNILLSLLYRLIIRNFWSHETRLPSNTLDRLLALNSLYSPKIEMHFLSLATDFLLEMTSMSPDYLNPVFEHPLSECEFQVKYLAL